MDFFKVISEKHGPFRLILQDRHNIYIIITEKNDVRYIRFESEEMLIDELILFEIKESNLFAALLRVH